MDKILFIDRDGVLLTEPQDEQVDSIDKVVFPTGMLTSLATIANKLDYKLVMVTNQDGLGTSSYPESDFWPYQELLLRTLSSVGVVFDEILIDRSFARDNSPYRKPNTGLLTKYLTGKYDLEASYVIGDRWSDMQLAANIGCQGLWLHPRQVDKPSTWRSAIAGTYTSWESVLSYLMSTDRKQKAIRSTSETAIEASINLDGSGLSDISTGLPFFDHMLTQIARHGGLDLYIQCKGDLSVDEHHTIEDVAITLGQLCIKAVGPKAGMQRYGFALPMDDCTAQCLLDFGGRPWLEWQAEFAREKVGDMPTEMFSHFFKSFADNAKCNLAIKATGSNEHHKIESIFKAFAKALKMSITRTANDYSIPSTKGIL